MAHSEGQVKVSVKIVCEEEQFPYVLKYSKHFDEGKSGGANVNVVVSNDRTQTLGTKEEREKVGMVRFWCCIFAYLKFVAKLREEYLVDCSKGKINDNIRLRL